MGSEMCIRDRFGLFMNRRFAEAAAVYAEILEFVDDPVSRVMIGKCEQHTEAPLPASV